MTVGGTSAYRGLSELLPTLVRTAVALAESQGFDNSCVPEQGRLLSVLAGGWRGGRFGETGTGCGVGLAWMVAAADADTSLVSIELDESRARTAAALFADRRNVQVVHGDWAELARYGPFDLLVLDGGGKGKAPDSDRPLDPTAWLAVGGTVVLDDFTPFESTTPPWEDVARRYWLQHPALRTTEIRLRPDLATLIGRRVI
jgi:predicted O-methyltransferase YrrM